MNNLIWSGVIVASTSWLLTLLLRRYALSKNLMDIPNNRSSHSMPTPRGGGVAIVLSFLGALLFFTIFDLIDQSIAIGLFLAGSLVAIIGFIDDHRHIAARWRLLVHFLAAGWVVFIFGGLPPFQVFGGTLDLSWFGYLLAGLYLVWLLNLYNFMDGIDGIASIEAITVISGGIVLHVLLDANSAALTVLVLLLAAVAGFLFWNFPQAKIFMGDVGSGFLGLIIGALSIQAAWIASELFWAWLILLGVFMVDATVTLIRRIIRKEKFYEAHCSHAYQYASRQLNSHVYVTISVGLINLLWLLPIAVLVTLQYLDGVLGLIIAYIPLIILAFYYKAGASELPLAGSES